jgi:4-diphosphocytidyl-2-C-methyl-D-erythritol kinase
LGDRVALEAPAKVNLFLRVLGPRPDGYHEIDTLLQSIDLADDVRVELGGEGIDLVVDGPWLGPPESNLAYRAAAAFREASGLEAGVRIDLAKRIPAGAGLGGGSSDAAAVLACMAALTGFGDRDALSALGAELGSDVPFFLCGSPLARGSGRGEVLEPLPSLPVAHVVVVTPPVHVVTAEAYTDLAESRRTEDPLARRAQTALPRDWGEVARVAVNDFEAVIAERHPEVRRSLDALVEAGARMVLLSGSGAGSFGVFDDASSAGAASAAISNELGWPAVATMTRSEIPHPHAL